MKRFCYICDAIIETAGGEILPDMTLAEVEPIINEIVTPCAECDRRYTFPVKLMPRELHLEMLMKEVETAQTWLVRHYEVEVARQALEDVTREIEENFPVAH